MGQLKLIIGAAGSGKTQRILEDVARRALESPFPTEAHPPLLVIIPEQQAMQTERAVYQRMAELSGRPAASARVNVMSFSRLASVLRSRVGQEYKPLGDLGRRLLVWQLLGKQGKAKAEVLANLIGELSQNGVEPATLEKVELSDTEEQLGLIGKLDDLSSVYADYCTACTDRKLDFLDTICGIESLLSEENWQHLSQTEVWLDGFTGFTGPEERAIGALLMRCKAINATVLLDPAQTKQANPVAFADWFKPTRELYSWWEQTANRLGVLCEVENLTSLPRWHSTNPLSTLAMCQAEPHSGQHAAGFAEAIACGDDRSEVDFAARKVVELVSANGYRYNDISIITRDISAYSGLISARFADHNIPTFVDQRRSLTAHPAVVLFLNGLKMALGTSQPGDAQALLKTELLPGAESKAEYRNQISLLEQAYTTSGKRPSAWLATTVWETAHEGLDQLRQTILAPVFALRSALQTLGDGGETLQKVLGFAWEHLLTDGVSSLLEQWANEQEKDNPVEAQIHRGVLTEIAKTLDALVQVGGNETFSPLELCGWLEYSFEHLALAAPPPVLDAVLVTDIERGRHHPVKAVVLLGMAADTWPHPHKESPYLSDAERQLVCSSAGRILSDTAHDKSAKEPYFAMVAATRPSHYLALTRPSSDSQGKAREPSTFYTHFCKLLGLTETTFSARGDNASLASIATFSDLVVAAALQGKQSSFAVLVDELAAQRMACADIQAVIAARDWHSGNVQASGVDKRLNTKQMGALMPGPEYAMSASRLESFAACPFQHFAHYYLGLKQQSEPALDGLQLGSFYHQVLQRIVETLINQGYDWVRGSTTEFKRVAKAVLADEQQQLHEATGRGRSALIHSRAQVLLGLHAEVISTLGADGGRVPVGVEVEFGDHPGDILPAVRLPLGDGELVLSGKIDRVDIGGDGSAYVVDYKLGAKDVDWQLFLAGAQIQLPLYLMAVEGQSFSSAPASQSGLTMQASAASYAPIEPKWVKDEAAEVATLVSNPLIGKPKKNSKDSPVDNTAKIQAVIAETRRVASELGQRILAGEFAPLPLRQPGGNKFNACRYCSFAAVCRFDPLAGGKHRPTVTGNKAELYKRITEGGGHCGS